MAQTKMCGAASEVKEATEEIQEIIKEIRDELESKVNQKFPVYKAISYRSQVVAGTNFFVKIQVDDNDYVHVRIFRPLPHTKKGPELSRHQTGKSKDEPLEYF
ncbi:hypothetical protein Btru_001162 [Bulinus truncatus]|nr:hypothetical protein Btru_001162 [Bulinus truncatus]